MGTLVLLNNFFMLFILSVVFIITKGIVLWLECRVHNLQTETDYPQH